MREIVLTDDAVLLSFVKSLLRDAGIEPAILDRHASALRGAAGMARHRVMVETDRWPQARRVLVEAGLSQWIVDDGGG